ncbi:MAG: hypothetical protein ACT4QE_19945 [Anaerolineales bacterium]
MNINYPDSRTLRPQAARIEAEYGGGAPGKMGEVELAREVQAQQ